MANASLLHSLVPFMILIGIAVLLKAWLAAVRTDARCPTQTADDEHRTPHDRLHRERHLLIIEDEAIIAFHIADVVEQAGAAALHSLRQSWKRLALLWSTSRTS